MPHRHGHVLATWHKATPELVHKAVAAALEARREWASWPFEDRAAVFLRAAESGAGIFEMDPGQSAAERKQFLPIVEWIARRAAQPCEDLAQAQAVNDVTRIRRVSF